MMTVPHSQRILPAIASLIVGLGVSLLLRTPFGLLAPIVALFLFCGSRSRFLLISISAVGLVGSLLFTALHDGDTRDAAVTWAAFFAIATCIGLLTSSHGPGPAKSIRTSFRIQNTARDQAQPYPIFGPSLQEKAAPRYSPIVSVDHEDDNATPALILAASFWGGLPLHMRYWRRESDGNYRWVQCSSESASEPNGTRGWRVSAAEVSNETDSQALPTKVAFNPPREDDAIRAAKHVEKLLGNAWAFDVAGRPTYLTPAAQTFVAVTLAEFQAAVDEGHTFFKCTAHPEDYDRFSSAWRHSLQTGEPLFLDRRIRRATGVHEWNRTGFVPTRDEQGRVSGWYGSTIDLDSHRITQAELRDRERELSQLVDMVPSHLWRLSRDGEPIFFNKRMVDFLGLDIADLETPGRTRLEAMIESIHPDDATTFRVTLQHCFTTGERFAIRYRLRRADGTYRWMSSRAEPMRDQEGRITQWYGLCQDIEDQIQIEEVLRRSEQQLQQLIDTVPTAIWCATPSGIPYYLNRWAIDALGVTVSDLVASDGSRDLTIIHPDDREAIDGAMTRSFMAGEPYLGRYRQRRANGTHRWVESRAEALRDGSGNVVRWYGVSIDIHDLVTAQDALRDRERELSHLVNMVPVHIRHLTPQGDPIFFNKRLMDFFGLDDVSELDKPGMSRLAATIHGLVHTEDAARLLSTARSSFHSGDPFSIKYRMRRADGAYRWVDTRGEPFRNESGTITRWYVVSLDIDDEMRAQQALQERERELQQLVDVVPVAIARLSPNGDPTFFNKGLIDFLGLDYSDLEKPGMSLRASVLAAAVHPDDLAGVTDALDYSLKEGEPFHRKYRLLHASGYYRWIDNRIEPLRDYAGTALQWYGVCVDIDDQMRLIRDVQEREAKIRRLVDSDVIGIVFWDLDGTVLDANDAFLRMLQYDRDDLMAGLDWFAMTPPEWQEMHALEEAEELVKTGKMQAREKEYFRKDGSRVPILIGAACFEGNPTQGVAYILDLTERKRAEAALRERERELHLTQERLAHASQAASLAELSASIAHEVNQPLAAVVAHSHACQRWLTVDPPNLERARTTVARILRDANSAADVVARTRSLFKQDTTARSSTSLEIVIADAERWISDLARRHGVTLHFKVDTGVPPVTVDQVQIQQVLINLMRNAVEAMTMKAGERKLQVSAYRHVNMVQIEVCDTGPGVEDVERIFKTFYTTKKSGMGMGLAVSRSIVESHGGRLWADQNPDGGARFIFTLPTESRGT